MSSTSSEDTWKPSDVHLLIPTLVLTCGIMPEEEAKAIQYRVQERLGSSVPADALQWAHIKSPDDASEERIAGLLSPFLKLEYVEKLSARAALDIPSNAQSPGPQVIVAYDLTDHDGAGALALLQKLEIAVRKLLSNGTKTSLVLLVIGDGEPGLGRQTTYWPRFRLQSRTYSGLEADRGRVLEVCQNLIVALITSELTKAIEYEVGAGRESVGWIWIGASALVADLDGMREFMRESIFHGLVHPIISARLTEAVRQQLEARVKDQVLALQAGNLVSAMSIVSQYGWLAESERGTRRIHLMDLNPEDELTDKIFKPASNLSEALSERYRIVRRSLMEHLGEVASEGFKRLRTNFAFRLEPRPEDYDILSSTRKVGAQSASLSLEVPLLPGLAAATFAVEKAAEYMTKSPDAYYPGLVPHPVGSDYYLAARAALDANTIHGEYRRYRRYERTILSPQGFSLKLIPAWPILTAAILVITDWERPSAALASALLLVGLATIHFLRLRGSLANWGKRLRSDIQKVIRLSVLGVIANLLRGYRLLIAGWLQRTAFTLRNLLFLLDHENEKSLRRIAESRVRFDARFKGQATVYWLADWDICHDYVQRALRLSIAPPNDFQSSLTKIIARSVLDVDERPIAESGKRAQPYQPVFNEIEEWVEQLTQEVFHAPELKAHALTAKEEPLTEGRLWKWLYEKAEPLGGHSLSKAFTIFAGENPAAYETTTAALNEGCPYWIPGCRIAMSRQQHEISCIRGVIEEIGERHGMD